MSSRVDEGALRVLRHSNELIRILLHATSEICSMSKTNLFAALLLVSANDEHEFM